MSYKKVGTSTIWTRNMFRFGLRPNCLIVIGIIYFILGFCDAKVSSNITCDDEEMRVEISGAHIRDAYLKGLKHYPEPACQPNRVSSDLLKFRLSLKEFYRCGTSQILNKITGSLTFYNRVIVVDGEGVDSEILVRCKQEGDLLEPLGTNHLNATLRLRRQAGDILPAGFEEEDAIPYPDQFGYGPEPILSMAVKQEGRTIGQELLVQPGSPLTMEVSLIERSLNPRRQQEDVYGIIVSKLDVTDTQDQSEVLIINGCSVDPYLFDNFATSDGDLLTAKFRAFKFPDTNYVFFRGTVNVCLGICRPSDCSNGQIGYGRRRRSLTNRHREVNGLYEVRIATLLRIANPDPSNLNDDRTMVLRTKRLNSDEDLRLQRVSYARARVEDTNSSNLLKGHNSILILSALVSLLGLRERFQNS